MIQKNKNDLDLPILSESEFPEPTTFSNRELIEEYLAWKQSSTKVAYKHYRPWVTRFQHHVNRPPETWTHQDYVTFTNTMMEGHSPQHIQRAQCIAYNYIKYFALQGRIRFGLQLLKVRKADSSPHYTVTEEEYQTLLATATWFCPERFVRRNRLLLMLYHDTGARLREILSLDLSDITHEMSAVIKTEKSTRKRRLFWSKETDHELRLYLKWRGTLKTAEPALFVCIQRRTPARLTGNEVGQLMIRLRKAAGLKSKVVIHSFRHAFIHRMARKGVPDAVIAQMIGHSTSETVKSYTHLSRPELEYFHRAPNLLAVQSYQEQGIAIDSGSRRPIALAA